MIKIENTKLLLANFDKYKSSADRRIECPYFHQGSKDKKYIFL